MSSIPISCLYCFGNVMNYSKVSCNCDHQKLRARILIYVICYSSQVGLHRPVVCLCSCAYYASPYNPTHVGATEDTLWQGTINESIKSYGRLLWDESELLKPIKTILIGKLKTYHHLLLISNEISSMMIKVYLRLYILKKLLRFYWLSVKR